MAIREMFSVWTSALTLSCVYLSIRDIECSECSDLASLLETPSLTPCQTTTTHVTGSSVVFDFYDSYNLGVDSCSCSVMIPSTTNFELSMYAYYGLGIDSNPGCGSKIEVNSNQSGSQIMECRVFGSISMQTGDQAIVKLTREPNADSRYCMIMSTVVIIIPVVVGVFFLLLLVVLVTQLAKTCRTKSKQNPEIDMEKIRFGQTFPKNGVFLHPTDMVETTHYDSKEDLHGHNDRYIGVTNPVYIHEEFEYLPEITDLEVANFTSNHDSESGKIISGSNNNNTHDAPLYAVVNKSRTNDYLDFSKMADFSSKSSSDLSGIGMLDENERNLRQEESFHY
ncbi:uncharacterized protein LOC117318548 [Pecten maximus]|uniref:uncharacterized protein LOC117318548 n=1 Tax=Pecten maximus TaxID=6579 RepID=UPI00145909BF|nr:uncharacterized protein LOC117318548 [Pecten maximus]